MPRLYVPPPAFRQSVAETSQHGPYAASGMLGAPLSAGELGEDRQLGVWPDPIRSPRLFRPSRGADPAGPRQE
jgi:hypothetical protein